MVWWGRSFPVGWSWSSRIRDGVRIRGRNRDRDGDRGRGRDRDRDGDRGRGRDRDRVACLCWGCLRLGGGGGGVGNCYKPALMVRLAVILS